LKKSFESIVTLLQQQFTDSEFQVQPKGHMPWVEINSIQIVEICQFLKSSPELYFDYLTCVSGVDLGLEKDQLQVVYHFYSIPFEHNFCIKVTLSRNTESGILPKINSISQFWYGANWHERETGEMFGIVFENHPDFRRLLLPADWEGYPLRKDYTVQENYHEIKVQY